MYLAVEERDASASTGYDDDGWTHYLNWPQLDKVKEVQHYSRNDSGQSTHIGNMQYQIVCSNYCAFHIRDLNMSDYSKSINEWNPQDASSNNFRSLGITHRGNTLYMTGWYDSTTGTYGIYKANIDASTLNFREHKIGIGNNGICFGHDGLLYSSDEDSQYLNVYDIISNVLVRQITLPTHTTKYYRGVAIQGNQIVVSSEEDSLLTCIDYDGNIMWTKDVSGLLHNTSNLIYGCWFSN